MTLGLIIFGIITGSLLSVLVGLIGSRRRIGFGWTFLLSVVFTPVVGIIAVLLSQPLPNGDKKWGCLGSILGFLALFLVIVLVLSLLGVIGAIAL